MLGYTTVKNLKYLKAGYNFSGVFLSVSASGKNSRKFDETS